jgi:hypothetical protein
VLLKSDLDVQQTGEKICPNPIFEDENEKS